MDLKEIRREGLDWVDVACDKDKRRAVLIAVMIVRAPRWRGGSLLHKAVLATEDGPTPAS
jgi:hypothetical protein